jgi:hypothetical protein
MKEKLQSIAQSVVTQIPKDFGFFMFIIPTENASDHDGRANYVSNIRREDVIKCMKEFIIKSGTAEDWMKHL